MREKCMNSELLSALSEKRFSIMIKTKNNDNGGTRHNIQRNSSLSNGYYPTVNTHVRKLFIYVTYEWDMCQKEVEIFSTYMLSEIIYQILSIRG